MIVYIVRPSLLKVDYNCYLETGLICFCLLPKSFVSVLFHCVAPFVIET